MARGLRGTASPSLPETPSAKPDEFQPSGSGGHPEGDPSSIDVCARQKDQSTRPVCVALNALEAEQPPSTIGSR
jgi:hypothetical protein